MNIIYESLLQIYPYRISSQVPSKFYQLFRVFFLSAWTLGQLTLFFWGKNLDMTSWDTYIVFWEIISFSSIDQIAFYYDFANPLILSAIVLPCACICMIGILVLLCIFKRKSYYFYIVALRVSLFFNCEFFYIPIIRLLFCVLKYSSLNYEEVEEYAGNSSVNDFNYGTFGIAVSVMCIVFMIILTLFYESCSFEIRFFLKNLILQCKSNCKVSIINRLFQIVIAYLFTNLKVSNYSFYLIFALGVNLACAYFITSDLSFYCFWENVISLFIQIDSAIIALTFIIGLQIKNASITVVLWIIMQPILMLLSYQIIKYRQGRIKDFRDMNKESFRNYELTIRNMLYTGELKEELLNWMIKNYKTNKSSYNKLFQAYYCSDILGLKMLGLAKISSENTQPFDICAGFQVFKCKKYMHHICQEFSESLKLLNYFSEFTEIKSLDLDFCESFRSFLKKCLSDNSDINDLKMQSRKVIDKMKKLKKKYEILLGIYPSAIDVKELYGSLLINILNESDEGRFYLCKSSIKKKDTNFEKSNSFALNRSFVVISGDKKSLGHIKYFTKNFTSFLGLTSIEAQNLPINLLLPKDFRGFHNFFLERFVETTTTTTVFRCSPSFMLNFKGFLCQFLISSELIGDGKTVNFLCRADLIPDGSSRAFCFLYPNGQIKEHSKNFPEIIGVDNIYIENLYIQELLKDFDFEDFYKNDEVQERLNRRNESITMTLDDTRVGNITIKVLYIGYSKYDKGDLTMNEYDKSQKKKLKFLLNNGESTLSKNIEGFCHELSSQDNLKSFQQETSKPETCGYMRNLSFNEKKLIQNSLRTLSFTKLVLIISIAIILIVDISILIYFSKEVSRLTSLKVFLNLSDMSYSISFASLISRMLDIDLRSQTVNPLFNTTDLRTILVNLKDIQDKLQNSYDSWSYCPVSSIVHSKKLTYWELESSPIRYQGTLPDVLDLFIKHTEKFILHLESNDINYKPHLYFISFNGMGSIILAANQTIEALSECEIQKAQKLTIISFYLVIGGGAFHGLLLIALIIFLIKIDKSLNRLWKHLRKKIYTAHKQMNQKIIKRLVISHDYHENEERIKDDEIYEDADLNRNYRHSVKYVKKFSLIFALSVIMYGISYYTFLRPVDEYLSQRPLLIKSVMERRVQLMSLCFYSLEKDFENSENSLARLFPENYPISDPKSKILYISAALKYSKSILIEPKSLEIMDTNLKNLIFEKATGSSFIRNGLFRAAAYLSQESLFIAFNKIRDNNETIEKYISNTIEFTYLVEDVVDKIFKVSGNAIENKLNGYMAFVIFYCAVIFIVYMVFINPFLRTEIMIVKSVFRLLSIIPSQTVLCSTTGISKLSRKSTIKITK
ncbi:hypothetical protein SteCoe_26899 [Stentor coeruleus]|uniref:TmcB/TmcC TPR repeats domain-containing protein n=1 Tax=Stentor coeruleus TaxID=5963 RepID=A0A1R2BBT2_9CILI|nr:hypothetical protein SteCoe_26899 [Stentor coeruleus]